MSSRHSALVPAVGEKRIGRDLRHAVLGGISNCIIGWILDFSQPDKKLSVRISVEGRDSPPIDCGIVRADNPCHKVTLPDGREVDCGFVFRVPVQPDASNIRIYEVASHEELAGSPIHHGILPYFEGFLEEVRDGEVVGWAWSNRLDYVTEIDVHVDGLYISTCFATEPRDDLPSTVGTGQNGFACALPQHLFDGAEHEIGCRFHATERHLNQSPVRVVLPDRVSNFHAALGADSVIRGVFQYRSREEAPSVMVDVRLDDEYLTRIAAQRCPPVSGDARQNVGSYAFSAPCLFEAGRLEIAVDGQRTRFPVDIPHGRVPAVPVPNCGTVDEIEQALVAERAKLDARPRKSKLLLAIWGSDYIDYFCELCLPSLLSPNNIPKYIEKHPLEFVFLTRSTDYTLFEKFSSVKRLRDLVPVNFIAIDDILSAYFDPQPRDIYAMALTFAYFRGIQSCGEEALVTDFIFWNGDFLASDGTFATLADIVAEGGHCTMAASIRADLSARHALVEKLTPDGASLQVSSKDLVRMALAHPHPTVEAQTLNRHTDRTMKNIKQFYWQVEEDVLLARYFVLFMLHIRPEKIWDDIIGFCDYAFVPDMVPSGDIRYELNSDRICIFELQDREREAQWIREQQIDRDDVARAVDFWATHEHYEASRHLVVLNGSDKDVGALDGVEVGVGVLDAFMQDLYSRMSGGRAWHNEHYYWRLCIEAIGRVLESPIPKRPRSSTSNTASWTGYDLDQIRESWGRRPSVHLQEVIASPPAIGGASSGSTSRWLDDVFHSYLNDWSKDENARLIDHNVVELVHPYRFKDDNERFQYHQHFCGCRWGIPAQHDGIWWRPLGPDGAAILLHRTTQRYPIMLQLRGRTFGRRGVGDLGVLINRNDATCRIDQVDGSLFSVSLYIPQDQIIACEGRLVVLLFDKSFDDTQLSPGFGFTSYFVCDYERSDPELKRLAKLQRPTPQSATASADEVETIVPELSDLLKGAILPAGEEQTVAIGGAFVGFGWQHPFSVQGVCFRWVAGEGVEAVVAKLTATASYKVEFFADRVLSAFSLVAKSQITINGRLLPHTTIDADEEGYVISAIAPPEILEGYGGWISLKVIWPQSSENFGGNRIEYDEPSGGGIALRLVRLKRVAAPTVDHGIASIRSEKESAAAFWKDMLSSALPGSVYQPGLRQRICERLGVDAACYDRAVRGFGGRALASWVCCQQDAVDGTASANVWLDNVDRAIASCWAAGAPAPATESLFTTEVADLQGTGFGALRLCRHGAVGRLVSCLHPTRLHLALDGSRIWQLEIEFGSSSEYPPPACVAFSVEDGGEWRSSMPLPVVSWSLLGTTIRANLTVTMDVFAFAAETTVLRIDFLQNSLSAHELVLIGVHAIARDAEHAPSTCLMLSGATESDKKNTRQPSELSILTTAAEILELDPWLYVSSFQKNAPEVLYGIVKRATTGSSTPIANLFTSYDYLLAGSIRTPVTVAGTKASIDLRQSFDGARWGRLDLFAGSLARRVGPSGCAFTFFRTSLGRTVTLSVESIGVLVALKLDQVTLSINGEVVPCRVSVLDENRAQITTVVPMAMLDASGGDISLAIDVEPQEIANIGFVAITLSAEVSETSDAQASSPPLTGASVRDEHPTFAVLAGFEYPPDVPELVDLPGLTRRDRLIRLFGRDPALYRAQRERGSVAFALIFDDSAPRQVALNAEAKAWLDLLDRTFVEDLIRGFRSATGCPVLRNVYALGWGPLARKAGGLARELSGAGDAMVFIPPGPDNYVVSFAFAADSDRQTLLRLKVKANRRDPLKCTLSFNHGEPTMSFGIDASITEFGGGWVAIRLYIPSESGAEYSVSFRTIESVQSPFPIAVKRIEITPRASAEASVTASAPEPAAHKLARSEALDLPAAFHCVVPVWGEQYLKIFLAACLPAHLAAGNLQALKPTKVIYELYTDPAGRKTIEQHPLYPILERSVDEVVFFDIREFRYGLDVPHRLVLNYQIMNRCHQTSIARATAGNGALLFLNCDTVYSDGFFARFKALARSGFRLIENLSIRTERDEILPALQALQNDEGVLAIPSRDLTKIALKRLHWIAKGQFWFEGPGLSIPNNLHWWVDEAAMFLRSTHFMPVYIYPRTKDIQYSGTIDHGLVVTSGITESEKWLMTSETEPSSYEVSMTSHDQRFNSYERGSARDMARFLGQLCESGHLRNLERTVRFAGDDVPAERWREIEAETSNILANIRARLQRYVLTGWRPDHATISDECDLNREEPPTFAPMHRGHPVPVTA